MKLCLTIFLIFSSLSAFSTDKVRVYDTANMNMYGTTNATFLLNSVKPSGDGNTEATAANVYVPMDIMLPSLPTANSNYFKLNAGSISTNLFGYNGSIGSGDVSPDSGETTLKAYSIAFPLKITTTGGKYLQAAVKNGTTYYIVARDSTLYTNVTDSAVTMSISPQNICRYIAGASPNCSSFDQAGSPTKAALSLVVYFFVASTQDTFGTTVADLPTTYPEGLFFKINLSSKTYSAADIVVALNDLRKGDRHLTGTFSSSSTISTSDFKETVAFNHATGAPGCTLPGPVSGCAGAFFSNSISSGQSGEFNLTNLVNETPYTISVGLADKYGFVSALSNYDTETPIAIEELLKKQSCYILTAGFGEEHYITNFFRSYRDHVLAHSWFGKNFIRAYYHSAPHYALIIYKSEAMRFVIRTMAYILYFFFNYGILVLLFFSSCYYLNLRKNKISLE